MQDKILLIYIASNGRSGSTLLDLLLGAHQNIWTLGEFQVLPWEIMTPRQTCGCGEKVTNCPFWNDILNKFGSELTQGGIHIFRQAHGQGKVLRWSELTRMCCPRGGSGNNNNLSKYGRENALVMQDILHKARQIKDIQYLVDASKDPYRLYWLAMSGLFQIYCIHLTKDPLAFVYSMIKNDPANIRKTLRMSLRYVVQNIIIDLVRRKCPGIQSVHIRYEDLASKPQETMHKIFLSFGMNASGYDSTAFRHVENHAISGNQMRHRTDDIKFDEKWRSKLPKSRQNLIKAITCLSARRYGYF